METTETKYIFFMLVNTERIRQGRRLLVILPLFMTVLIALFFIFLGILPKFHQTILIQNIQQNESPNYCEFNFKKFPFEILIIFYVNQH